MKNLYILTFFLLLTMGLIAQTEGPRNPGSYTTELITGSNKTWLLPENVASSDDAYSNFFSLSGGVGSYTDYLVATNFGFSIPSGANIKGISVEVERADPNGRTADYRVRIVKGGVIGTADHSAGAYPAADTYTEYGSAEDLWGETWSNTDINAAGFGIAIAAQRSATGGGTAGRIDHIRITIHYDNAVTLPVRLNFFSAAKVNNAVTVKWRTTDESNMSHYTIERSGNGSDFIALTSLPSQNNPFATDYNYTDNDPIRGVSYYRLKMTGNAGEVRYSAIVAVQVNDNGSIDLYPTLLSAGQLVNIRGNTNDKLTINFYTHNGQKVASLTTLNKTIMTDELESQKGILYYQVVRENGSMAGTGRIMIQ